MSDEQTPQTAKRRSIDWASAAMAAVAIIALLVAASFRFGWPTKVKPVAVGEPAPILQLVDLDSSESVILLGLKGKVVWLVFWSAEAPDAPQTLAAIARASSKLRPHRRFTILTAAVEADQPNRVRSIIADTGLNLPVYLASAETRLRFGAENANPPLQVLIDSEGRIMAIARGASPSTLDRLADQVERRLEELDPQGTTRFAFRD